MINLIKNELIKIFSKKAIYVMLTIYVIIVIASIIMTNFIEKSYKHEENYLDM